MSLYRHVPSKTALLHAVAEAVLSDVTPPDPRDPDWREQVLASARSFRAVIGKHPRVMPLIHSLGPASPALVALWEASLAMWVSAGADPYTAAQLHVAVGGYAIGAPLWEASLVRGTKQDSDEPAAAFVASADRLRRELAFELGLGLLLDGIESELARRQSASPPDPIDLAA